MLGQANLFEAVAKSRMRVELASRWSKAKQDMIGNRSQVSTYGRHLSNLICI